MIDQRIVRSICKFAQKWEHQKGWVDKAKKAVSNGGTVIGTKSLVGNFYWETPIESYYNAWINTIWRVYNPQVSDKEVPSYKEVLKANLIASLGIK